MSGRGWGDSVPLNTASEPQTWTLHGRWPRARSVVERGRPIACGEYVEVIRLSDHERIVAERDAELERLDDGLALAVRMGGEEQKRLREVERLALAAVDAEGPSTRSRTDFWQAFDALRAALAVSPSEPAEEER